MHSVYVDFKIVLASRTVDRHRVWCDCARREVFDCIGSAGEPVLPAICLFFARQTTSAGAEWATDMPPRSDPEATKLNQSFRVRSTRIGQNRISTFHRVTGTQQGRSRSESHFTQRHESQWTSRSGHPYKTVHASRNAPGRLASFPRNPVHAEFVCSTQRFQTHHRS